MTRRQRSTADGGAGRGAGARIVLLLAVAGLVALAAPAATVTAQETGSGDLQSIEPGETYTGSVDDLDPIRDNPQQNNHEGDWYYDPVTFEGEAGDVVSLAAYGDVDMSLVLLDPSGDRVADNEDGGPGQNAEVVARLPEDGTYTLQVMGHYPETEFDYVLSMEDYSEEYSEDPGSIGVGESTVGYVDWNDARNMRYGGYYDTVPLDVRSGQNVTVEMSASVDSALYLVDDSGRVMDSEVAWASGSDATLTTTVPGNGQYSLLVASGDDDPYYAYRVSVSETPEDGGEVDRETTESSSGHHDHESAVSLGPDPQVVDVTANRTEVAAGDPVELTATVANFGDEEATVERTVAGESVNATVAAYSLERVTVTRSFEDVGPRSVAAGNETATVHVTAPEDAGQNAVDTEGGVVGYEPRAAAGEEVTFATEETDFGLTALDATATADGAVWFRAETLAERPDGVEAPADDPLGYVALRGGGDADFEGVADATVSVHVPHESVTDAEGVVALYRYDESAGAWERAPTRQAAESDTGATYRAPVGNASLVAVATVEDPVERRATLDSDARSVTVAFENRGPSAVERSVTVAVDGAAVGEETVTVPAGESVETTVELGDLEPGAHEVTVDGAVVGELQVEGETDTPAPTPEEEAEAEQTDTETATPVQTTAGEGPGFGIPAMLAALVALALLERRRGDRP